MFISWMLLGATAVLFFLSIWIVVPAPDIALLPLGVAAPEWSPFLLAGSLVVGAIVLLGRRGLVKTTALGVTAASAILCLLPLARVSGAVRAFDEAMRAGPPASLMPPGMRPYPLVVGDLAGIDTGEARVAHGIEFAAPEGNRLTATIYRPISSGSFPILVQIYGGAWRAGAPDDNAEFARYFASRGYVVFAIDYRHAPRWQWPAQIDDVRAALSWIRANAHEYEGDVTRMALVGRSSGAQLALVAAYEENAPRVSAVVSFYGPVDLAEGWRVPPRPDPLGVRPVLETYLGGTPDQKPAAYRAASPITYVSHKVPPTLLIYGARDHVVEAKYGRFLHDRLRAAGATSVMLEIPWSEHAFDVLPGGLGGQISLYYTERFLAGALGRAR